jgi:hypothetical protein
LGVEFTLFATAGALVKTAAVAYIQKKQIRKLLETPDRKSPEPLTFFRELQKACAEVSVERLVLRQAFVVHSQRYEWLGEDGRGGLANG